MLIKCYIIVQLSYIPCQHSKYCAHNKSHNEGYVFDGIDLHSSSVWIQTEVIREVEAKQTAQVEHLRIRWHGCKLRMYTLKAGTHVYE